jgi:hypothetical protein
MSVIDGESTRVYNKTLNGLDTLGDTEVGDLTVTGDLLVEGASSLEDGLDMNSTKITQLANGTASTDAVNLSQLTSVVGDYLPLAGGTMTNSSSDINMNSADITGITDIQLKGVTYTFPTALGAVNKVLGVSTYTSATQGVLDWISTSAAGGALLADGTVSMDTGADLDMNSNTLINLKAASANGEAVRYNEFNTLETAVALNTAKVGITPLPDNYGFAGRFLKTNADGTTEWAAGAGGGSLWTTGAGTIIYYNSGLVGINKTTPVARLHVKGTGDYNSSEPIILTEDTRSSGTPRSTSYVSMGINGRYDYNGEAGLELNRGGYQNGYTQFRNVYFFDGKNALKGTFTGQTGNLNIDGLLTAGVGQVGTWSANTDFAFFGYSSNNTAGNYAMIQQSTGYLYINRPTGKSINFRENNGVSQVFIKSGGNVGIGTVDPNERLVVTAEATATLKHMRLHNTAQWYGPRLYFSNSTLGNTNENCYIGISDTAFNINATHANSYIRFNTAVSDSMRIMNDGNIGISNTAPPERLTIGGTGNILIKSGYLEYIGHPTLISGYEGFRLWRSSSICYFDTGSNGTVFRNWDGAGTGYTQMTLRADGNILTSPSITSASNNRSKGLYFWSDLGFGCEMTYLDSSWASTFHGRTSDYWWFRLGGYPSNASAQSQFVSVAQGGAYSQFVTMAQPYLACSCHTASDGSMTHVTNLNGSSSKPSGMITGQYRYYLLPVGIRPNTSGNYIVNVSFFGATDGSTNPRTANINQQSTYFDVWVRNHNATRVDHAHMITVTFFAGNP